MDNKRLFVSLPIDEGLSRHIFKEFGQLDLPWEKIKAVSPSQLHLTLKFIGDTSLEKLPLIIQSLEQIKTNYKEIELKINKSKIFNPQSPRVLALAIETNPKLSHLQKAVEEALALAGAGQYDAKKFTPHLTLARIKKKAEITEFKNFENWQIKKTFYAAYFQLMESELGGRGSVYSELQTFEL
ncbi:MAG: RNA 2',3'-cyclic phosphodiesterase [Patescibacteria group bacterium]|nr:RNA 2',3'-cyclic phosphodiesterase [Patescibacteria group bacterium]